MLLSTDTGVFGNDLDAPVSVGWRKTIRTESLKLLVNYLLQENKRQITEIVLFKPDITSFSSEERKSIRELFKKNGINVRCIFIQERDFSMIKENGWRKELFRVLQISKNTKWG